MSDQHGDPDERALGERWRDGVARQARAVYESAHGNPISDEARGVRWAVRPRVALTACLAALALGAMLLWALREPEGALVAGPDSTGAVSSAMPGESSSPEANDAALDGFGSLGDDGGIVVVDVAGYVVTPGVRELPVGSRVGDAIDAAGGLLPDAARDTPNLARVLVDGEQVYVAGANEESGAGGDVQKINVNRADANALEGLPGVGPVLAKRIEEFRDAHGPFAAIDDLAEVSGIGPSLLAGLADAATV